MWEVAWTTLALPSRRQDTCSIAGLAEVVSAAKDGKMGLIADPEVALAGLYF